MHPLDECRDQESMFSDIAQVVNSAQIRAPLSYWSNHELMDAVRKYGDGRTDVEVLKLLEAEASSAESVDIPPGWELRPLEQPTTDMVVVRNVAGA